MSGTVDDFSEDGWYVDRRGWHWFRAEHQRGQWHHFEEWGEWHLTDAQMRVLVLRDEHRDECDGLGYCPSHPVSHVIVARYRPALFSVHEAGRYGEVVDFLYDLPAAVDAARTLAVSE